MAEAKKTAVVKPAAKAVVAKATEVKKEEVKKVETPVVKETAKVVEAVEVKKEEPKKEAVKKPAAKKTATKKATEKKAPAKKEAAEKKAAPAAKKVKEVVHVQFSGKSYTTEDLVQSAKDVWKYDLNQKPADFKTVELYVKPEENLAYYVINGDVTGSFFI
ncbi:MAG: hypothetical protein J6B68_05040 [Lachnospiraceae bacterium]|nr:hypothetical protein [Lachnospiraceae bacterium]